MGDKEWAPANLLDVFGDPVARAALVLASEQPLSAQELAEQLGVSEPTIYRRVDELVASDLLKAHHRVGENGNQHKEYETIMDEVSFAIDEHGYTVDVQVRQDLTDDFGALWSDLEPTGGRSEADGRTQPDVPEGDLS